MTARKLHSDMVRQFGITMMEFLGYLALVALFVAGALGVFLDTQFNARVELAYQSIQNVYTEAKKVAGANNGLPVTVSQIRVPEGWTLTPAANPTYLDNATCGCTIAITNGLDFSLASTDLDLTKALAGKKVGGVKGVRSVVGSSSTVRWTFTSL